MTTADIQTLVGYLIPQLAQQLQLQANQDERSYSGLTGYLRGNPTLAREAYGASREDAERQYAIDVAQLGIQQANLNFQQRVAEADTKLQELDVLARQRGPSNAIAYNYLLNNEVAPEGRSIGAPSIAAGINQPYAGATPQPGSGGSSGSIAMNSDAARIAADTQKANALGALWDAGNYTAYREQGGTAAPPSGNTAAAPPAPHQDQTPGYTIDPNGVNLSANEIANGATWHAAEGGMRMPEDYLDGPLGRVDDFDRGTAPWMQGPQGQVADPAANMPWLPKMASGGTHMPDGKAWGYGPTREPLLPPLEDAAYGVPSDIPSRTAYLDWLAFGAPDGQPNYPQIGDNLQHRAQGGITMGEPVIVGDPKAGAPQTPNIEMAAPVSAGGEPGMAVMPVDKMAQSAQSPAFEEGYDAQMQGQADPQRMQADKEYLAGVMACQADAKTRGIDAPLPKAADGGVFSNTAYSGQDIANAPSIQKLAGNLGTGFGATGLDYSIPGAGGAGIPQANRANITTLSRMLPSELGFTQGVVETPRAMGGLGLDWQDYLAGAKRSAPSGATFSGATVYG